MKQEYKLFLLPLILLIGSQILENQAFASSPSFVRSEITDNYYDAQKLDPKWTQIHITPVNDIVRVTYVSNGKVLNVTLWLNGNSTDNSGKIVPIAFEKSHIHRYGIYIDADNNPMTGANGVDYIMSTQWNPTMNKWTEVFSELTSDFQQRDIYHYNYSGFFDDTKYNPGNYYVSFSIDLGEMNFPRQYKIEAFALDQSDNSIDFTRWIPIPSPEFTVSTSPASVVQGGQTYVDVQINSTKGYSPNITMSIPAQDEIQGGRVKLEMPYYGINNSRMQVTATPYAKEGAHPLTILATASFPLQTTVGPYYTSTGDGKKDYTSRPVNVENISKEAHVSITILNPQEYVLSLINPFSAIYQAMAPVATGIITAIAAITTWHVTRKHEQKKHATKKSQTK